jgi:hypothetical protein
LQILNATQGRRVLYAGSLVVGALSLNVTRLLALIADLLATGGALGAVAREVAVLAAVVTLAAVDTVAYIRSAKKTYPSLDEISLRDMCPYPPHE